MNGWNCRSRSPSYSGSSLNPDAPRENSALSSVHDEVVLLVVWTLIPPPLLPAPGEGELPRPE